MEKMTSKIPEKNKLFKKYHETRTTLLDRSDQEKLEWFEFYFEHMYAPYFKEIDSNASILELGCNKGYLLNVLNKKGYHTATGVDLSKGDLQIARHIAPQADFVEADIFSFLDQSEQFFDVVILKALIEHIEKNRVLELLEKIYRALRPGGVVLIDVYNADWFFSHHDRYMDFTHETGFTQESLTQILLFSFKQVSVKALASPLQLGFKDRCLYNLSRLVLKKFLGWAEPEMKQVPILERLLIGYGKK